MTAILAVGRSHEETARSLQVSINKVKSWTNYWSIKLNESKSVHINFSNKRNQYIPISINNAPISYSNTAKYLGITLNAKLLLKAHVKSKREELGLKYKKMYWLLGKHSTFSTYNKLLLYKQIFKPVWTYGIQLWGCAKKTNIDIIQRFQNKVLRNVVNAPLYFRNSDLHRDLDIETVDQAIERFARSHEQRLLHHVNVETIRLLDNTTLERRLKRTKPFDSRGPKLILVYTLT
ncbi:hypothetical protein WA026_021692 [Henosepilachna vigintioctopunctata]|uniref:Uncharacterized protein n=1 Tax=Henosepilachna vigintioctopunctata TaxID=420089 RepID=A0AAW1UBS7_9CUCU